MFLGSYIKGPIHPPPSSPMLAVIFFFLVVVILLSLLTKDIKYIIWYLLVIYISSFDNGLLNSLAHFLMEGSSTSVLGWVQAEGLPLYFQGLLTTSQPTGGMLALWVYIPATSEDDRELAPEFDIPAGSELLNPRVIFGSDLSQVTFGGPVFLCVLPSQSQPPATFIFQLTDGLYSTTASLSLLPHRFCVQPNQDSLSEDVPYSQVHRVAWF